jgi:hypothetical protein
VVERHLIAGKHRCPAEEVALEVLITFVEGQVELILLLDLLRQKRGATPLELRPN